MAGKRQFQNGTWQYVFKRVGVLEKPLYLTFDDEEEGDAYAAKLDALLDRGILPTEYKPEAKVLTLAELVKQYELRATPSSKDKHALTVVLKTWGATPLSSISAQWVDNLIIFMKRIEVLAPATIRARIGALARCTDWGIRKGMVILPDQPFRTLPDGYAQYSKVDEAEAGEKREDIERGQQIVVEALGIDMDAMVLVDD